MIKKPKGISPILREKRIAADITQMEAAKSMGHTTAQYISNLERGLCEPSVDMAVYLWEYYGGKRSELLALMLALVADQLTTKVAKAKGYKNKKRRTV